MAIDFPSSPAIGQQHPFTPVPGQPVYIWDGEKWIPAPLTGAVRYDAVQSLSGLQQTQARDNIGASGGTTGAVLYDAAQSLTATQQQQARQNTGTPAANLIINGDFRVNQGGYTSATALSVGTYGHDQWKAGASGGDYSFTQLKSSTQITIASGKSLIQPIEDVNVVGGSYVLTWTGTAQARAGINTLTPSGAYAASPLLIVGQTAGTAMSIEFNSGTLGTVKLESGTIATPFIMRSYDQELVTCQRYYAKTFPYAISPAAGTANQAGALCLVLQTNGANNYNGASVSYPVAMRAVPTITSYSTHIAANSNWYNSTTTGGTVFGATSIGDKGFFALAGPTGAAEGPNMRLFVHVVYDARL